MDTRVKMGETKARVDKQAKKSASYIWCYWLGFNAALELWADAGFPKADNVSEKKVKKALLAFSLVTKKEIILRMKRTLESV